MTDQTPFKNSAVNNFLGLRKHTVVYKCVFNKSIMSEGYFEKFGIKKKSEAAFNVN